MFRGDVPKQVDAIRPRWTGASTLITTVGMKVVMAN